MDLWVLIIISLIVIALVLAPFFIAINKGYSYEHKVDPLPDNEKEAEKEREQ
ncbi:YtzI protein [Jeotgalibacillus sp. R-1-5s-1]|uniref:YtzI protein n=1 Tax=Jeotgalibacillus sp. R-1-5s-1 TaxID=2555897 RepID=UPI00106BDB65|nr:YtzI protein [Jeotgalibacillus sp. R-1-5s-1]TFD98149.1 YtzI protein [Jeotgalibacillus sp. R-1-5s-1]